MGCVLESDFAAVIATDWDSRVLKKGTSKSRADRTQQQLDAKNAKEASERQTRADAQAQFERLPLAALDDNAGKVASFGRIVYKHP